MNAHARPSFSRMYELLIESPDDVAGAFAYMLYKAQKVEFVKHTFAKERRRPTTLELNLFHDHNCLPQRVGELKERGEVWAERFVTRGLASRITEIEASVRTSVLSADLETVRLGVDRIEKRLASRRTLRGWLADVGGNLVVNILTIALIGAVIAGYKFMSKATSDVEQTVGLSASVLDRDFIEQGNPLRMPWDEE